MRGIVVCLGLGVLVAGCSKKSESDPDHSRTHESSSRSRADESKDKSAGSETPSAAVPAATSTAVADAASGDVPAEEDFEGKAESGITPENAQAELAKLEKEIGP